MADAMEIGGYISTATGLCLNLSDFAPSWVILQTILFLISSGLAVFDTYTDWKVVLNFQEVGFNNPLLPRDVHWLRTWFLFASIGTILTVFSVGQDGLGLLHSMYQSCKLYCSKNKSRNRYNTLQTQQQLRTFPTHLTASLLNETSSNTKKMSGKNNTEAEVKSEDEKEESDNVINDPCKCCYLCGCNTATRNETLGAITLWFQNVPMLTIAILYGFSQSTCKLPDTRDVTPILKDVGISAIAAILASLWRCARSFVRVYTSVGSRLPIKNKRISSCLPKKGDALYPSGTYTQCCIFPFFFGIITQLAAIFMACIVTFVIWLQYTSLMTPNFDDSLGIYRFSLNNPDVRLFDISGNLIPPNGSFVNLEQVPSRELTLDEDLYCLSEFEYRPEEFQINFNAIQLVVISDDARFCASYAGPDLPNFCVVFYTFRNFVLYYASIDPITGAVERFDDQCSVVKDRFNYFAGPVSDFTIDVMRHVDRTGFPENNEPLIIFYPFPINIYVAVSSILSTADATYTIFHTFEELENSTNVTCLVQFEYDSFHGRVNFNYRDVYTQESGCGCSDIFSPGPDCRQFHQNLSYAYLTQDSRAVPYTQCSEIPQERLVPYHDPTIIIGCFCS